MKRARQILTAAIVLLIGTTAYGRGDGPTGLYLKGDIGGSLVNDTDLDEFFGENVSGTEIKFDPGLRLGIAAGYQVTEWFSPELEFGAVMNGIKSAGPGSDVDASFSNLPLTLNAKFQLPNRSLLTPYAGAGIGFSTMVLDADYMEVGSTVMEGAEADVVFTWHAFAGLRFKLNDNMGINLEYRYISSDSPKWEAEFTSNTFTDSVRFGRIQAHTISLAFEFKF